MIFEKFICATSLFNFQKWLLPLSGNLATCSLPLIHSVSISFFALISFTLAISVLRHQSLSKFDDFESFSRETLSILQRNSCSLDNLNVSYSITAINTPASAASLRARVSESNRLFVTQSSFFYDQHFGTILFILP